MAPRFPTPILITGWLLAPLAPAGLLLASGFVFNTDMIAKSTAQQAGWIILLIFGIAALIPPFLLSYTRLDHIWEASSHVGGGCYKLTLASISALLLLGSSTLGFFTGFWYAAPQSSPEWRTRWNITLSFALVLYVVLLGYDLYIMGKVDSEEVNGKKLAWNIFTPAALPTHRQAEIAARDGDTFYYPHIEHVTHDSVPATSFNLAEHYQRARSMNIRYGGHTLGWNQ